MTKWFYRIPKIGMLATGAALMWLVLFLVGLAETPRTPPPTAAVAATAVAPSVPLPASPKTFAGFTAPVKIYHGTVVGKTGSLLLVQTAKGSFVVFQAPGASDMPTGSAAMVALFQLDPVVRVTLKNLGMDFSDYPGRQILIAIPGSTPAVNTPPPR